jgi:glycosyltransferase involved in cell wall biosynthesis
MTPDVPVVSVVIPTRDRRAFLTVALRSVLQQSGVSVEVVVVDDGSTDGTSDLVAGLRDPRVRLFRHASAAGVSAARNHGIAEASGEWIALLDDDDLWAPDKLTRQLEAADRSDRVWAYAGAVEIDAEGRLVGGAPPPAPETLVAGLTRRNLMPAGSSNVVVRAEELTQVGGVDERLRHLADWDLWLRLAAVGPPACAPDPLVAYRIHRSQATLDTTGMIEEAEILEARHGADRASIYRWLAWSHLRRGHRGRALRAYLGAVRAGDAPSLLRAGAVLLPSRAISHRGDAPVEARGWLEPAEGWLRTLTGAGVDTGAVDGST